MLYPISDGDGNTQWVWRSDSEDAPNAVAPKTDTPTATPSPQAANSQGLVDFATFKAMHGLNDSSPMGAWLGDTAQWRSAGTDPYPGTMFDPATGTEYRDGSNFGLQGYVPAQQIAQLMQQTHLGGADTIFGLPANVVTGSVMGLMGGGGLLLNGLGAAPAAGEFAAGSAFPAGSLTGAGEFGAAAGAGTGAAGAGTALPAFEGADAFTLSPNDFESLGYGSGEAGQSTAGGVFDPATAGTTYSGTGGLSLGDLQTPPLGGGGGGGGGNEQFPELAGPGSSPGPYPTNVGDLGAAGGLSQSALQQLSELTGLSPSTLQLLGGALTGLGGVASGLSQSSAITDIANQQRADRLPALTAYNNALANPNTFYNSAPAMGATDAVLRKLSMQGNPASNPGALSQAAAYNLGGYNDYLKGLAGPAFGTSSNEANINLAGAQAQGTAWQGLGAGLNSIVNPRQNYTINLGNYLE